MSVNNEIYKFIKEFKQKIETKDETKERAEVVFVHPLSLLYNVLKKLLKDNKVIKEDSEHKKITKIVGSIIKV
jgi:hypothetical protein